jgi:hypothetical protein
MQQASHTPHFGGDGTNIFPPIKLAATWDEKELTLER